MEGLSTLLVFAAGAVIVVLALIGLVADAGRHERDPHRRGGGDGGGGGCGSDGGGSSCGGGGCGGGCGS